MWWIFVVCLPYVYEILFLLLLLANKILFYLLFDLLLLLLLLGGENWFFSPNKFQYVLLQKLMVIFK